MGNPLDKVTGYEGILGSYVSEYIYISFFNGE